MPILHVNFQEQETLYEFYEKHSKIGGEHHRMISTCMEKALILLDSLFIKTTIFGMTSHLNLLLMQSEKDPGSEKVTISNSGYEDYYYVRYKMVEKEAPWDNAWVNSGDISISELGKYILIGMKKSEGWEDNLELKELLKNYQK